MTDPDANTYTREQIAKMSPAMEMATQLINGETSLGELFGNPVAEQFPQEPGQFDVASQEYDWHPNAEYPDRPDHQDFRDMATIVADMDAVAEAKGWDQVFLPMGIDPASIQYISRQRVLRAQQLLAGDDVTEWDRLAVMWIDAFTLAATLMQERMTVQYVLDESVDTHHRSRGHQ